MRVEKGGTERGRGGDDRRKEREGRVDDKGEGKSRDGWMGVMERRKGE